MVGSEVPLSSASVSAPRKKYEAQREVSSTYLTPDGTASKRAVPRDHKLEPRLLDLKTSPRFLGTASRSRWPGKSINFVSRREGQYQGRMIASRTRT